MKQFQLITKSILLIILLLCMNLVVMYSYEYTNTRLAGIILADIFLFIYLIKPTNEKN